MEAQDISRREALIEAGNGILTLTNDIAERKGSGHTNARRISNDLRKAIQAEDEEGIERVLLIATSFFSAPAWRHYTTAEDESAFSSIMAPLEADCPDFYFTVYKQAKYNDNSPENAKKKRLTIDDLRSCLANKGIDVRRNLITHGEDITGWDEEGKYSSEKKSEQFAVILSDELGDQYTGATDDVISKYISVIAGMNEYNPVLELLSAEKWDEVDRLPELFRIIGISEKDSLSRSLVEKWMRQAVALQFNGMNGEVFAGEGVLTFTGEQFAGKTRFCELLTQLTRIPLKDRQFFNGGADLDPQNKDSLIENTDRWIVELGELDATFNKADIARLKSFITRRDDTYRSPYDRKATTMFRRTSYFATVNRSDFLVDETGNRRWWVIEIEKPIDCEALEKMDVLQLWRQIYYYVRRDGNQSFRLTREEFDELNIRNGLHERMLPGEQELRDILSAYNGVIESKYRFEKEMKKQTASQICEEYELKYRAEQIGKALNKLGCKLSSKGGVTVYGFPTRKYNSPSALNAREEK